MLRKPALPNRCEVMSDEEPGEATAAHRTELGDDRASSTLVFGLCSAAGGDINWTLLRQSSDSFRKRWAARRSSHGGGDGLRVAS